MDEGNFDRATLEIDGAGRVLVFIGLIVFGGSSANELISFSSKLIESVFEATDNELALRCSKKENERFTMFSVDLSDPTHLLVSSE